MPNEPESFVSILVHIIYPRVGVSCLLIIWVTVKIGINGLDPDLYWNKNRINPEYVEIE
jgi:hypothetical protein